MARRLKAVPKTPSHAVPGDLRDAVAEALVAMPWLGPADNALKTLALRIATEIEMAVARAELLEQLEAEAAGDVGLLKRLDKLRAMCEITKTVGWLGPQLQGVLRDLGGTPAARVAMKTNAPIGGRLAQLREDAAAATGEHDPEDLD